MEGLSHKNHKKQQDKLHPIWRRLLYLTDVIIRFQFGKDIRLFGMRKWLIKKYDDSSMEEYRNLKEELILLKEKKEYLKEAKPIFDNTEVAEENKILKLSLNK